MKIKITPRGLIFFQIVFNLLYRTLEIVGVSVAKFNYISHGVAIFLLFFMLKDKDNRIKKSVKFEAIATVLLVITTIIGVFVVPLCYKEISVHINLGMYMKGILNFYRFFIFFFAITKYLNFSDVKKIFSMLEKIFILNLVLCCIEYFLMGYKQDFLGGIFGVTSGGNIGLNILLCFFAALYSLKYLNKKVSILYFVIIEIISILLATMAELKIYYIELVLIMVIAVLLVKPNRNTVKIILSTAFIMGVGIYALSIIFPEQLAILMNSDKISAYAGGSYVTGSLGRMTMFQELEGIFFQDYPLVRFFGFGIGTFDPTSSSYWANAYSYLKAGWFGNSSILLNLGYVGLLIVYAFYINLARKAFVWRKKCIIEEKIYMDLTIIMIMLIIVSMWYNSTILTGTISYLLHFIIAIPIIIHNEKYQKNLLERK